MTSACFHIFLLQLLLLFHRSLPCVITGKLTFIDDRPFSPDMMDAASVWLQAHAFDHVTGAAPSAQDVYSRRVLLGAAACSSDGTWALSVNCSKISNANCTFGIIAFQSFDSSGVVGGLGGWGGGSNGGDRMVRLHNAFIE